MSTMFPNTRFKPGDLVKVWVKLGSSRHPNIIGGPYVYGGPAFLNCSEIKNGTLAMILEVNYHGVAGTGYTILIKDKKYSSSEIYLYGLREFERIKRLKEKNVNKL